MNRPVIVSRAARREFDEAFDWYERMEPGLGVEFENAVRAVMDRIAHNPEMHALVHKDIRKFVMKRFPYSVYYRVENEHIVVLSVFHAKRDPRIWQSRN